MCYAWDSFPNNAGDGALKYPDMLSRQKKNLSTSTLKYS